MRNEKDVEAYLLRLNRKFEAVEAQPGTFLVHTHDDMPPIAVRVDPPIVLLRFHIGDVPSGADQTLLYRKLLTHNAKALVHAAYGLEDDKIVLGAALALENLDFNEVQATLDELDVAIAQQVPELLSLARASARPPVQ